MIDLSKIIENGESEKIEFKNSLSLHNPIYTAISAFSNKGGGTILVGINDNKQVVGVSLGKNTLENLANEIQRNTDPHIFPTITVLKKDNYNVSLLKWKRVKKSQYFSEIKHLLGLEKQIKSYPHLKLKE